VHPLSRRPGLHLVGVEGYQGGAILAAVSDQHGLTDVWLRLEQVFHRLGATYLPPEVLIRSFLRSVIRRKPSASISPMSPVWNQPSALQASLVGLGVVDSSPVPRWAPWQVSHHRPHPQVTMSSASRRCQLVPRGPVARSGIGVVSVRPYPFEHHQAEVVQEAGDLRVPAGRLQTRGTYLAPRTARIFENTRASARIPAWTGVPMSGHRSVVVHSAGVRR